MQVIYRILYLIKNKESEYKVLSIYYLLFNIVGVYSGFEGDINFDRIGAGKCFNIYSGFVGDINFDRIGAGKCFNIYSGIEGDINFDRIGVGKCFIRCIISYLCRPIKKMK